ncbi:hypothetical protein [Pseudoscardovia suis]|uniref:hypothetical protein n=1 Tax=Pseudoscardovia suis TaxID=987063 RepID=UPI000B9C3B1D|nr:hypothetical protein [Pseudoscardovia suis]
MSTPTGTQRYAIRHKPTRKERQRQAKEEQRRALDRQDAQWAMTHLQTQITDMRATTGDSMHVKGRKARRWA